MIRRCRRRPFLGEDKGILRGTFGSQGSFRSAVLFAAVIVINFYYTRYVRIALIEDRIYSYLHLRSHVGPVPFLFLRACEKTGIITINNIRIIFFFFYYPEFSSNCIIITIRQMGRFNQTLASTSVQL